jgi:hypothetical protein
MWFGDITVGDPNADPNAVPAVDSSNTSNLINIASGLVSAIQPYKQGVPVNVAISPQTQSFLMMGGILVAGLVILSLVRR